MMLTILQSNQAPPSCSSGRIDRRVNLADGTVIDLYTGQSHVAADDLGRAANTFTLLSATAFRPDGAIVSALLLNQRIVVEKLKGQNALVVEPTAGTPLSLDQLAALVATPGLNATPAG